MRFDWIILALFLVSMISGIVKAITRPMVKNVLRLVAVLVSFLIVFLMQTSGVFQGIVVSILAIVDLASMLPILADIMPFINAVAGSLVTPLLFVVAFYLLLGIFYFAIFITMKIVEKNKEKKEAVAKALEEQLANEETSEQEVSKEGETKAEEIAECEVEVEETAEVTEEAIVEETVEEVPAEEKNGTEVEQDKPKKKKKPLIPKESAPKKIISICAAIIGAFLIFGVSCMPLFHTMEILSSVTDGIENSDADDSMIYNVVDVADEYIIAPYEDSFVIKLYDGIGMVELMDYTASQGGKMTLANGTEVCADNVIKNVLSHGVSAATQLTSGKSEYLTLEEDIREIISDPYISSILVDLICTGLDEIAIEEASEDDIIGGLVNNFVKYYQDADASIIEKDLTVVGATLAAVAKTGLIVELTSGEPDLSVLLSNEEVLTEVVVSISGLSAFGPTLESAFGLGVDMLAGMFQIPETDAEIYETLMNDLSTSMTIVSTTKLDYNRVLYYITNCAKTGKAPSALDGKDYNNFALYLAQWKKIHRALSTASEDKSLGCFTFTMYDKNGVATTYVYDEFESRKIVVYNPQTASADGDVTIQEFKVSPAAELINYLTHTTLTKGLENPTKEEIYGILEKYVADGGSAKEDASKNIALRILDKDNYKSNAVTISKLHDAVDFTDWTDEEKATDSKHCVSIIMSLMGLLDGMDVSGDLSLENASALIKQLSVLGETMDVMYQTSCLNKLPALLLEGVAKSDMCKDFLDPATAHSINHSAQNGSSYSKCIGMITSQLIGFLGSMGGK